jgi:hypothetical protein
MKLEIVPKAVHLHLSPWVFFSFVLSSTYLSYEMDTLGISLLSFISFFAKDQLIYTIFLFKNSGVSPKKKGGKKKIKIRGGLYARY